MSTREERKLRDREARLIAELERRRSTSERQAALVTGRDEPDDENGADDRRRRLPLTASEKQARLATGETS